MLDAADCFQNTWVALYTKRNSIDNPEKISSWLITTSKREALRLNRQKAKEVDVSLAGDNPDRSPLQDETLVELERQAQLEIALGEIDPRCRILLREFFFAPENRSYEEIAKSLGMPANSLGPIRHRCLKKLRRILEEKGYLDVRKIDSDTL
jgi:RNA polymerase sigma factor (sigma-70 family)